MTREQLERIAKLNPRIIDPSQWNTVTTNLALCADAAPILARTLLDIHYILDRINSPYRQASAIGEIEQLLEREEPKD